MYNNSKLGVIWLIGALFLASCGTPIAGPGGTIDFSGRTIQVAATTGYVADVVRNVGG